MASSVASESILFIGAIIAATAFAGVLTGVASGLSNDLRADAQSQADATRSDITIINDPGNVVASPSLVIYVKNTGEISLDPTAMVLVVNGALVTATHDVVGTADDTRLPPGAVVSLTAAGVASGDHRVRVVAGTGASASLGWSA